MRKSSNQKRSRSRERIFLPNGCSCSKITVSPFNWKSSGVSTDNDWYFQFYFYDPQFGNKGKLVIKKGMNEFKGIQERREITQHLIERMYHHLQAGYNPYKKSLVPQVSTPAVITGDIPETSTLLNALDLALDKLRPKIKHATWMDVKSCLKYFGKSAERIGFHTMAVKDIKTKHVLLLLENCPNVKDHWSGHLFNHYRTYLMMLFKVIRKMEAIEVNPVIEIEKEDVEKKFREVLTTEEVIAILDHFKDNIYMTRYIHMFFHSGDREGEVLNIKYEEVDQVNWTYRVTVRKGRKTRIETKVIKYIAIPYWEQQLSETKPGQYLFGKNLIPGDTPCLRSWLTKFYQREIKGRNCKGQKKTPGIGITKDLYSLKHKNLDETSRELSARDAQKAAKHKSKVITMNYLIGEKGRFDEEIRTMDNALGG